MREYDLITEWYASERVCQTGVPEVTALASSIPSGSRVFDIGCGNGIPITRALLSAGHLVVGFDSSHAMLARFRGNCPETPAVRGIVQSCPFADGVFDAAVAWGVMFHLKPEDQIKAIESVSRVLKASCTVPFHIRRRRRLRRQRKDDEWRAVPLFFLQHRQLPTHPRLITDSHCLTSMLTAAITPTTWRRKANSSPASACASGVSEQVHRR